MIVKTLIVLAITIVVKMTIDPKLDWDEENSQLILWITINKRRENFILWIKS